MAPLPDMYRIALSPFEPQSQGVHSVVGDLAPQGFLAHQLCLIGTPGVIGPLATSYPELRHLAANLEAVQVPRARVPIVASAGPITEVLFKHQSWLSSPTAAPLHRHLERGDVALAINALDHDQFVKAGRLLLRHGNGNLLTEIFHWPPRAPT